MLARTTRLAHHGGAMLPAHRIPPEVTSACRRLQEAGYAAYVVGGAVRDLLRCPDDDTAKDFDLTTSATPDQVIAIFGHRKVIPTGITHGTVTVLCDREGGKPHPIEITTFRGEVGFTDGRRPDRIEFITDLVEDLRRRDFTVNAIAWDPVQQRLVDPFDGQGDLGRRLIRAVGDPVARFAEDGLRVMRAVRFSAQLGFVIEANTRAAFAGALSTLRKVSRERTRDELLKLLGSPSPAEGLRLMLLRSADDDSLDWGPEGNMLQVVLPEVAHVVTDAARLRALLGAIEQLPVAHRLGALLWPMREWLAGAGARVLTVPRALAELLDERLKLPVSERQHLAALLTTPLLDSELCPHLHGPALRRLLAQHPGPVLDALLAIQRAYATASGEPAVAERLAELVRRIEAERALHPPLSVGELVLSGKDLIAELSLQPGPVVGELLRELLVAVLDDPARNDRAVLLARAKELLTARNFRH